MNDNFDIKEWIRFAQMDYDAAKNISVLFHPVPLEIVCFHCQQAAEKILKAYALANGEPLMKTHDLSVIIAQCKKHNQEFSNLDRIGIMLNDYAVIHKYPTKEDTVTEGDMNIALDNALEILEFAKVRIAELMESKDGQ
ncbi:MAG: HEPN domain-containing protein [Oscillospiraceae bacterium]|nr:HEPN domain-containing protein [Oscillospiraceae bacterium]